MAGGDWKEMLVAVQNGDLPLVKYHIESGINPNYQHPELLTTPLIESISFQQYEIAEYLLNHGADPELKAGFSTDSPLKVAKQQKNPAILELLRQYLPNRTSWLANLRSIVLRR
ncbi:MAG: ankyrin repeat domain-containing protein [Bacteroidota bacterium]